MNLEANSTKQLIAAALTLLGVERLALAIHDQSFPSDALEEIGRGSPYSLGGRRFAQFISELGFNAVQLGPQGKTAPSNPSPYDSTLFSKNEWSISLHALAHDSYWEGLLSESDLVEATQQTPSERSMQSYRHACDAQLRTLRKAFAKFVVRKNELQHLWLAFTIWQKAQEQWLRRESLFEALSIKYGTDDWRQWAEVDRVVETVDAARLHADYAEEIEFFQFRQFVAHHQHQSFREHAHAVGLKLYADLQIGFSHRDMWALRHLLLPNYLLGAPPSRTNPDGQPWGYPVLNPDLYFSADGNLGPALEFVVSRIEKLLQDFDGIRVDHPHGIVCPWIYKDDDPNPLHAVQHGSRLFESPNSPEHAELARFAVVREDQLNKHIPRYGDAWVAKLDEDQIKRYSVIVKLIKDSMAAHGLHADDLLCEVLSSCPFPLKAVLQHHKLGRFRVTQKAQPHNERDVYRSTNSLPEDWIMVGTHDTKPIWRVIEDWTEGEVESWAEYLSERIEPDDEDARDALYREFCNSKSRLMEAIFADLFIGPARNVSVFFSDLFGLKEVYNRPGVICDENWVLSVPNDFEKEYERRLMHDEALNLPRALALALRARFKDDMNAMALVEKLNEQKSPAQAEL